MGGRADAGGNGDMGGGGDGGGAEKKGVQTLEDAMFGTHRRPVVQKKARKRK